ncbi:MAG: histidinol dehydrogenase, partial [Gammaproteobacteria bacterium]
MSILINRLDARAADFPARLTALLAWDDDERPDVTAAVKEILAAVRREGDSALLRYTNRFDRRDVSTAAALEVDDPQASLAAVPADVRAALEQAATRIRAYHEKHKAESWDYREADGTVLGQLVTPLDRVGIYVPGGKAAYPSSVLMNAIPAKVAGVGEIVMSVPSPYDHIAPVVLAAAAIAGVDR